MADLSLAGWITLTVVGAWLGCGAVWLLANRRYKLHQIPRFVIDLLGFPVELTEALFGRSWVPYAFLLPNMLIFGIFTFAPVILNFYVSFTGGESISLFERPWVGGKNYRDIFACESVFEPNSCSNAGQDFWVSLGNTLLFIAVQVPVLCAAALVTALIVNKSLLGRGFWRAMFFYPVMLSPVVIANIWKWMLHRKGVLNEAVGEAGAALTALAGARAFDLVATVVLAVLMMVCAERFIRAHRHPSLLWGGAFAAGFALIVYWANPAAPALGAAAPWASLAAGLAGAAGLVALAARASPACRPAVFFLGVVAALALLNVQFDAVFAIGQVRPVNWLVSPNTGWPFFWLVFVFCWAHMGFYMLILLAGLQAIPRDLYEAAEMDAASPARIFFRITFPLLMPTFTVVVVLALIRSFQIFDEVYLLTGGGPGRETFMIVQNIYEQAFTSVHLDYGEAAAGSVLMAAVIAAFTFTQLYVTRRQSGI